MQTKTFRLIALDEGGVKEGPGGLRLVCQTQGGGKLAVWGSHGCHNNIDTVLEAGMPCEVECGAIPAAEWATRYGHTDWVPEGATLRVLSK